MSGNALNVKNEEVNELIDNRISELMNSLSRSTDTQVLLVAAKEEVEKGTEKFFSKKILPQLDSKKNATIIVDDIGGNPYAVLSMALDIRQKLRKQRISCIVPRRACSAFGLFPLLSNQLIITKTSHLTQIDIIMPDGRRAKDLTRSKDKEEKEIGKYYWSFLARLIKAIRKESPIFETKPPHGSKHIDSEVGKFINRFLRKDKHTDPILWSEFEKHKIRTHLTDPDDDDWRRSNELVMLADVFLDINNNKVIMQYQKAP